jgi:hypothetical protein
MDFLDPDFAPTLPLQEARNPSALPSANKGTSWINNSGNLLRKPQNLIKNINPNAVARGIINFLPHVALYAVTEVANSWERPCQYLTDEEFFTMYVEDRQELQNQINMAQFREDMKGITGVGTLLLGGGALVVGLAGAPVTAAGLGVMGITTGVYNALYSTWDAVADNVNRNNAIHRANQLSHYDTNEIPFTGISDCRLNNEVDINREDEDGSGGDCVERYIYANWLPPELQPDAGSNEPDGINNNFENVSIHIEVNSPEKPFTAIFLEVNNNTNFVYSGEETNQIIIQQDINASNGIKPNEEQQLKMVVVGPDLRVLEGYVLERPFVDPVIHPEWYPLTPGNNRAQLVIQLGEILDNGAIGPAKYQLVIPNAITPDPINDMTIQPFTKGSFNCYLVFHLAE